MNPTLNIIVVVLMQALHAPWSMQRYDMTNIWSEIVKYEFLVIDYPLGQKSGRAQGANFLTCGPNSILTPDSSSPWSKTYISV